MLDQDTRKMLTLFADNASHSFFETLLLGKVLLKMQDRKFEKRFKRTLLENGWVRRLWKSWDPRLDFYQLTSKGDECFRASQIETLNRGRYDSEAIRHYRHFDRSTTGKYGVGGFGKDITEKAANLREKFPHLYK